MRTPSVMQNEEHWVLRMPEGRRTAARHRRGAVRRAKHICPPARCTPSARGPTGRSSRGAGHGAQPRHQLLTGPREGKAHAPHRGKRMFLRCGNRSFSASQEENQAVTNSRKFSSGNLYGGFASARKGSACLSLPITILSVLIFVFNKNSDWYLRSNPPSSFSMGRGSSQSAMTAPQSSACLACARR